MSNPKFTTHPSSLWKIDSRAPEKSSDKGLVHVYATCRGPEDRPHEPVQRRMRLTYLQSGASKSCGCVREGRALNASERRQAAKMAEPLKAVEQAEDYIRAGIQPVPWVSQNRRVPTIAECLASQGTPEHYVPAIPADSVLSSIKKNFIIVGSDVCRLNGEPAGTRDLSRYCEIRVHSKWYKAHHIAFYLATGRWPAAQIDHVDGDKRNNAPANLREVTQMENVQYHWELKLSSRGLAKGVTQLKNGTFMAFATKNGLTYNAPISRDAEEAALKAHQLRVMLRVA